MVRWHILVVQSMGLGMKAKDLTNIRFGLITPRKRLASRVGKNSKKVQWLVDCDCGNSFVCDAADIVRTDGKARVSCGCRNFRRGTESPNWKSPNEIPSTYWSAMLASAKTRNIEVDLTIEFARMLFNGKCALSGQKIYLGSTASLDRIDSYRGYEYGNVQWVHKDINRLKSNFNEAYFKEMCRKVAHHNE